MVPGGHHALMHAPCALSGTHEQQRLFLGGCLGFKELKNISRTALFTLGQRGRIVSPACSTLRDTALQVECMFFRVAFLFQSVKTKHGAPELSATAAKTAGLQTLLKWLQLLGKHAHTTRSSTQMFPPNWQRLQRGDSGSFLD